MGAYVLVRVLIVGSRNELTRVETIRVRSLCAVGVRPPYGGRQAESSRRLSSASATPVSM